MKSHPIRPISVELEPIEGTHLHRRYQGDKQIAPVYMGPGLNALPAIEEAKSVQLNMVHFAGSNYVNFGGEWYVWWCSEFEG